MAIYLKLGDIKGNVTADGHDKWIECASIQWGVGRSIYTPTGAAANREASAPSVSEVTLSKTLDDASIPLFQKATTAKKEDAVKAEIHITKTGEKLENLMEYTLHNTMISGR